MEYNSHLLLLLLLSIITLHFGGAAAAKANVSAIYAFGDSIFDAGNNNHLPTLCRSDHQPYGIDFPGKVASGRFTDGMLPADMLISYLGIKTLLPAYLDPNVTDDDLPTGVSFACSCSGFDEFTAMEVGVMGMDRQYDSFQNAFERMQRKIGLEKAVRAVENALFLVSGGSNDMMDNYYANPLTRIQYSLTAYHDYLLKNLETLIKRLQKKGAKMFAVIGMPPLGCLPMDASSNKISGECVSRHNIDAKSYNDKLQGLIKQLVVDMPGSKTAYVDIYRPMINMIDNPKKFGLEHTLEGCCGSYEFGPLCSLLSHTCEDPSKYIFWDAAHPTETAYKILTKNFQDNVLSTLLS